MVKVETLFTHPSVPLPSMENRLSEIYRELHLQVRINQTSRVGEQGKIVKTRLPFSATNFFLTYGIEESFYPQSETFQAMTVILLCELSRKLPLASRMFIEGRARGRTPSKLYDFLTISPREQKTYLKECFPAQVSDPAFIEDANMLKRAVSKISNPLGSKNR